MRALGRGGGKPWKIRIVHKIRFHSENCFPIDRFYEGANNKKGER